MSFIEECKKLFYFGADDGFKSLDGSLTLKIFQERVNALNNDKISLKKNKQQSVSYLENESSLINNFDKFLAIEMSITKKLRNITNLVEKVSAEEDLKIMKDVYSFMYTFYILRWSAYSDILDLPINLCHRVKANNIIRILYRELPQKNKNVKKYQGSSFNYARLRITNSKTKNILLKIQKGNLREKETVNHSLNKDKLFASIRTAIRVGVISSSLILAVNTYKKFQIPEKGRTVYENKEKLERTLNLEFGLEFVKNLQEIGFNDDNYLRALTENENYETLFEYFWEHSQKNTDVITELNRQVETTRDNLREDILKRLKDNNLTLEELGLTNRDLNKVLDEIARRRAIYAYSEFFESEIYKNLPIKNRIFLGVYLRAYSTGFKPVWSTKVEQKLVEQVKSFTNPILNDFTHEFNKLVEQVLINYREEKIKEMGSDLRERNLQSFLNNFSKYALAHPIVFKALLIYGAISIIYCIFYFVPLTHFPTKYGTLIVKNTAKKTFKLIFKGTWKDLKVLVSN